MPSPSEQAVRDILREAGRPMTIAEIGEEMGKRLTLTAKNPRNSARTVLNYNQACVRYERGKYVYTRMAVNGASVRDRLRLVSVKGGYCAVGAELIGLLWPGYEYGESLHAPQLSLENGPTVEVSWPPRHGHPGSIAGPDGVIKLPAPFWKWWDDQRATGADELLVRCDDGEAGTYSARAIRRDDLDPVAIQKSTAAARKAAGEALRGGDRGSSVTMLVLRLLVRPPYHQDVPPDPLSTVLLSPYPRFNLLGHDRIEYRPDLTPDLARLLQDRLLAPWISGEEMLRSDLKLSPLTSPSAGEIVARLAPDIAAWTTPVSATDEASVVNVYRIKIKLKNVTGVSRTIEARDDQTLEDVHDAIQDAFGWENDRLYAFYLGNRRYDPLTSVQRGSMWGVDPPTPDDVTLSELGFGPKRSFLYVFDFGDSWIHELTIQTIVPADGDSYPRLVASEGDAPKQYAYADDDGEWDDGDDTDDVVGEDWLHVLDMDPSVLASLAGGLLTPFDTMSPGSLDELLDASGLDSFNFNDLDRFAFPPADPTLRRVPINLNELAPAFELVPPGPLYLDAERGDILLVPPVDTAEIRLLREAIEASPQRYLPVPVATGEQQLAAMGRFVDTVADPRLQARLKAALLSKHPVDRFYRALERDEIEATRWNDDVDHRVVAHALAWLASHSIYPDPPSAPEPPIPALASPPRTTPSRGTSSGSKRPKKRRRK